MCLCIPHKDPTKTNDPEAVARRCLSVRGVVPMVQPNAGDAKAHMAYAIDLAKKVGLCKVGDRVVGVHRVDDSAVMKIVDVE
jgi:pyruvate kinase